MDASPASSRAVPPGDLVQRFVAEVRKPFLPDSSRFCYGFGRYDPDCPFLFRFPAGSCPDCFSYAYRRSHPTAAGTFSPVRFVIPDDHQNPRAADAVKLSYTCAGDAHMNRVAFDRWDCSICHFAGPPDVVHDHLITAHCRELTESVESHVDYVSDDSEFMEGLFAKMTFEELIDPPRRGCPLHAPDSHIVAPILRAAASGASECEDWDEENLEEDSPSAPVDSECDLESDVVTFKAVPLPPLTAFLRRLHLIGDSPEEDWPMGEVTVVDSPLDEFLAPLNEMYKTQADAALARQSPELFSEMMEEEDAPRRQKKGKRPPLQPMVSVIERIPVDLHGDVLATVAAAIIADFGRAYCLSVVRPILQNTKKQRQKRLREARAVQARIDERLRTEEMRRRRMAKINQLAGLVAPWLVRAVLRDEINAIFAAELAEPGGVEDPLSSEATPVVVTGPFFFQKGLGSQAVLALFSGLKYALDDDGEPRVRFRSTGRHTEAVVWLAAKEDVRRAIEQSPITTEFGPVYVAREQPEGFEVHALFTGEKIVFDSETKNAETALRLAGMEALVRACPIADLRDMAKTDQTAAKRK
jgi:hypothetical protein